MDLVIKNFPTIEKDETISKLIGIFREDPYIEGVVVLNKGKYYGVANEKQIIRTRMEPEMKVEKIAIRLHPEKEINPVKIAKKMIESGSRIVPIGTEEKIEGIVNSTKLLEHYKDKINLLVSDLMVEEVITLPPKAKVAKAISIMRKKHISRIPIVEGKKVVGIITARDIIEKLVYPKEKPEFGERAEHYPSLAIPVEGIMTKDVITIRYDEPVRKAIEIMLEKNISGLPVVDENDNLVGIITRKDILEEIAFERKKEVEIIIHPVNIVLDELDKEWIKTVIERKIIRKFKNILGNYIQVYVYIKRIKEVVEQDNTMRFYTVRIRLFSEKGRFYAQDEGWELYNAIRNALEVLEEQLERFKEEKEKRIPKIELL